MEPDDGSTARRIMLSRIRSALLPHGAIGSAAEAWASIPRAYRRDTTASRGDILALFTERLRDYDAQVLACNASGIAGAVATMLRMRSVERMLVPPGFPDNWLPAGFGYVRDEELSSAALDACSGVLTTCTLGIAETGTIVLQNAPGQGRRALSLVPDYHLCVIDAASVVATVPEAMAALHATATLPTTFISGPSATADIEMTRIKGVHGPRFLDVLLVTGGKLTVDKESPDGAL
jgi:L-lactate dehydrogenase complex protein LldG